MPGYTKTQKILLKNDVSDTVQFERIAYYEVSTIIICTVFVTSPWLQTI